VIRRLQPGDVIRIPFSGTHALGKTIYLSTIVKDVFGFVVLAPHFDLAEAPDLDGTPYLTFELGVGRVTVLYADRKTVERDRTWPIVGALAMIVADRDLLQHGVGGTLYRGNEPSREFASVADRRASPQILTYGNTAVETVLDAGFRQAGLLP
jgi:hypothetical protein